MAEVKINTGDEYKPTIEIPNLPSNENMRAKYEGGPTDIPKPSSETKPKLEKAIVGTAKKKEESKVRKAFENFIGEDLGNIKDYVIHDVIFPTVKRTILDMIASFLGESGYYRGIGGVNARRAGGKQVIDYQQYWTSGKIGIAPSRCHPPQSAPAAAYGFQPVTFGSRADAQTVLDLLNDRIYEYGCATVADMYDLSEISSTFIDQSWGWSDVRGARIRPTRDGFLLEMPNVEWLR